jgi:uncharacterized membrane protein YgcG
MSTLRRLLAAATALTAAAALAPAAHAASSTASMSLNQGAGTSAGADHDLGLNLTFANNPATDSPKSLTLNLPAGLLANAAQDGGKCLNQNLIGNAACEVGTGTVEASLDVVGIIGLPASVPISVTYYLVPPPSPGDLAGLAVDGLGQQIGSTGAIDIRPSSSALGVGATIGLSLPDTLPSSALPPPIPTLLNGAVQISITSIDSTFQSLRYPTTCPARPTSFTGSATSYQGASSSLSAPLSVTGCGALPYSPQFSVSARRDADDKAVTLATNITQAANEAPSQSVALAFPTSVLSANLDGLSNLCLTVTGSCPVVGSVTAASPLYPTALTGRAYLTGTGKGLELELTFPAPFPLTLVGTVNLLTDTASFAGLPDIPLTSLAVTLNGGARGLFAAGCATASGTATAALVDQNGDHSRSVPAAFTVAGCPSPAGPGGGGGGGGGTGGPGGSGGSGGGSSSGGGAGATSAGGTHLVARSVSGLASGRPSITFRVSVGRRMARLDQLSVALPRGLAVRRARRGHRTLIRGVRLAGARARSLRISHGRLVITLRRPARAVTVTLGPRSLRESPDLRRRARSHRLKTLRLAVTARNTRHRQRTLAVRVTRLHL